MRSPSLYRPPALAWATSACETRPPRGELRAPLRMPCELRLLDANGDCECAIPGETVNVSSRGVAVQTPQAIDPGAAVEVRLPGATAIRGAVIRQRRVMSGGYELGIRIFGPASDASPS